MTGQLCLTVWYPPSSSLRHFHSSKHILTFSRGIAIGGAEVAIVPKFLPVCWRTQHGPIDIVKDASTHCGRKPIIAREIVYISLQLLCQLCWGWPKMDMRHHAAFWSIIHFDKLWHKFRACIQNYYMHPKDHIERAGPSISLILLGRSYKAVLIEVSQFYKVGLNDHLQLTLKNKLNWKRLKFREKGLFVFQKERHSC